MTTDDYVGNIPAHAGKTVLPAHYPTPHQEHPRARGENSTSSKNLAVAHGTSPRTRGKLEEDVTTDDYVGNIPAHAGKTNKRFKIEFIWEEHPRARGEN